MPYFRIAGCLFVLLLFTGCAKTKVFTTEYFNHPVSPEKTYVVLGQSIGTGNIERVSYALHVNGNPDALSKGVQIPTADYKKFKFPKQLNFLVTDASNHAYRIWEIDAKEIHDKGNAFLFCQMFSNSEFTWIPVSRTRIGFLKSSWMVPVEYQRENHFYGIAFTLKKPGIYYLGEASIAGTLISDESQGSKTILIGDYERRIQSLTPLVKSHLKTHGIDSDRFYDLSKEWKQFSWEDLADYKKGSDAVKYSSP